MLNTEAVLGTMNELLKNDHWATKNALLSHTNRLLDKYAELSKKLSIIKEISTSWMASFANRKAIKNLIYKVREAKKEIFTLINCCSSIKVCTKNVSWNDDAVIIKKEVVHEI